MIRVEDIPEAVLEKMREHAREGFPEPAEICGLLVETEGGLVYRAEQNMSDHPAAFAVDPRAYHEAANQGDLVAVVHSHNNSPGVMSDMDWQACNRSSLTWLIVQMPSEEIRAFYPQRQDERFVGRAYRPFELDAFSLVRDYFDRELGVEVPVPPEEARACEVGSASKILEHYQNHGFTALRKEEAIAHPHDIVLMQWSPGVWDHVGVLTTEQNILHHPPGLRSRVAIYGRDFVRSTGHYLRHESLC